MGTYRGSKSLNGRVAVMCFLTTIIRSVCHFGPKPYHDGDKEFHRWQSTSDVRVPYVRSARLNAFGVGRWRVR
jgi:hypothetical protein